jgi:hypothetical protein
MVAYFLMRAPGGKVLKCSVSNRIERGAGVAEGRAAPTGLGVWMQPWAIFISSLREGGDLMMANQCAVEA